MDGAACQGGADRDAAAEADDADLLGVAMEEDGQEAEQALCQHVTGIRRVDLPVDHQGAHAGQFPNAHRRGRTIFVVQRAPRPQLGLEVPHIHIRRVLVGTACEKWQVPGRQQEH